MTATSEVERLSSGVLLRQAVHRNKALSRDGLAERAFSLAFRQLVYPQIWEDPVIDMEALEITPQSRVVAIASGGCNVLSYLTADPAHITAVDLNAAHVALNRLKLCAARRIDDHPTFLDFFGNTDQASNVETYDTLLRDALDAETRAYWDGRDITGRRRVTWFARGFYRFGLLGRFIGAAHFMARRLGTDPREILEARSLDEQREFFERRLAPLFDRKIVRWALNNRASLYGLGIPPAQYEALARDPAGGMAAVVRERLERLACGHALKDNYFAWQAFARGYPREAEGALPPYLQPASFDAVRSRADRVDVRLISMNEYLRQQPDDSLDRYVLLDAQDWMNDETLADLWAEITRTARPGARVIFRTADRASVLPGRVPAAILKRWRYDAVRSQEFCDRDRSAIYGGFHLYVLDGDAS